jgi:hypothetical protein
VFLFQVTQPMNDVASAALWMGVLVAAQSSDPTRPWLLGFLTGLSVLVRPNLAPAAVVVALWVMAMSARAAGVSSGLFRRNLLAFVLGATPAAVVVATLNIALYGGPLASGYGRPTDLFAVANVAPNATRYARALIETQLGLPLLGFLAPVVLPKETRPVAWLTIGISLSVIAVYLLYQPYQEWWYLRFLLPALVPLTALAVAVIDRGLRLLPLGRNLQTGMASVLVVVLAVYGVRTARDRQAFELHRLERRFWLTAGVARERLPANAIFLTIWESGSLAHHADRPSFLWDSLDPGSLDRALTWLADRGLDSYIVVEQWEEPGFRERFAGHSPLAALDWPPRFEIDRQVRIYKPADRAAFLRGESVPTEHVLPR